MSLRALSKRIQRCSQDMDRQRRCTQTLLIQQKSDFQQRVQKIPLPAMIGLALVGGFLAQRIFHVPLPTRMFRRLFTWWPL